MINAVASVVPSFAGLRFRFRQTTDERGVAVMCVALPRGDGRVWGMMVYADGAVIPPAQLTPEAAALTREEFVR